MDHNELVKNLYISPIEEIMKKHKTTKRLKPKELHKEKDEKQHLPSLGNKNSNIIIQNWSTKLQIPKDIINLNLPIIVDKNKLEIGNDLTLKLKPIANFRHSEIGSRTDQNTTSVARFEMRPTPRGSLNSSVVEINSLAMNNPVQSLQVYNPQKETALQAKLSVTQLPTTKEGKEIIDFAKFNKHLYLRDNEFIYCKRVGSPIEFIICTYLELFPKVKKRSTKDKIRRNVEYLTISKNTVIHYQNGNSFIFSISEWIENYVKFKTLINIKMFRNFRTAKLFEIWRRFLRKNNRTLYTEKLKKKFHQIDSALLSGEMEIRQIIKEMTHENIFQFHNKDAVYINQFQEHHKSELKEIDMKMEFFRFKVKKELQKACDASYQAYKALKKITLEDNQTEFNDKKKENPEGFKPINKIDEEKKQRLGSDVNFVQNFLKDAIPYAQDATRRTHYKKLLRFIRMIDFLFNEAKFKMVTNSLKSLCSRFNRLHEAYLHGWVDPPILISMLVPLQGQIKYNPHVDSINKAIFEEFIQEKIYSVIYRRNFVDPQEFPNYMVCFEDVFEVTVDQNSNLNLRIKEDNEVVCYFSQIKNQVDSCFTALTQYAHNLLPILSNFNTYSAINFKTLEEEGSPEKLKEYLEGFLAENEIIKKLKPKINIGIFQLHIDLLIEIVQDAPRVWLEKIREVIPKVLLNKLNSLISTMKTHIKNLTVTPNDVETFIKLKICVEEIQKERNSIEIRSNEISDILSVIKDDKEIRIQDYDNKLINELKMLLVEFERKFDTMNYYIDNNIAKFRADLRGEISRFDKRVKNMITELNDETLNTYNEDPFAAILYLEDKSVPIQKAMNSKQLYREQEEKLEIEGRDRSNFENLDNLVYEYELKKKLWYSVKEFQSISRNWENMQVLRVDIPKMENLIKEWTQTCKVAISDLDVDNVPQALLQMLVKYENILPFLKLLQNPNMSSSEILLEETKKVLSIDYDINDIMLTVKKLMDIPIVYTFTEDILELQVRANEEKRIRELWKETLDAFNSRRIPLKITRNMKVQNDKNERFTIEDKEFEIEYEYIEEKTILLNKTLLNKYSTVVYTEILQLRESLSKYMMFLNEYEVYQNFIRKSDNIVHNGEFAKEMPLEFKKFTNESISKNLQKILKDNVILQRYIESAHEKVILNLRNANSQFETNFKFIKEFLNKKRKDYFGKFYFLSDEDMLDLYDKFDSNETKQKYIKKLLRYIKSIDLGGENDEAMKVKTSDDEVMIIKYTKGKTIKDIIETIEFDISKRLKSNLRTFKKEYESSLRTKSGKKPKEVLIDIVKNRDNLAQAIFHFFFGLMSDWIEKALSSDDVFDKLFELYEDSKNDRRETFMKLLHDPTIQKLDRKIYINLISLENYFISIIENLIREDVCSTSDFNWMKLLQFRIKEGDNSMVKVFTYEFDYGYEYVGTYTNFLVTPQTERAYLSIASCFKNNKPFLIYSLNDAGKKETIKQLAKIFGKSLMIFNCSNKFDLDSMRKLLHGTMKSGNWLCLDKVDLVHTQTFSVIAHTITEIYRALNESDELVYTLSTGEKLTLNKSSHIFCMNNITNKSCNIPNTIKNYYRLIGWSYPDLSYMIATTFNNIAMPNYSTYAKKAHYIIEYVNSKTFALKYKRVGLKLLQNLLYKLNKEAQYMNYDNTSMILRHSIEKVFIPFMTQEESEDLVRLLNTVFSHKEKEISSFSSIHNGEIELLISEFTKHFHFQSSSYFDKLKNVLLSLEEKDFYLFVGPPLSGKTQAIEIIREISKKLNKINNLVYPLFQMVRVFPKAFDPVYIFSESELKSSFQFLNNFFMNHIKLFDDKSMVEKASDMKYDPTSSSKLKKTDQFFKYDVNFENEFKDSKTIKCLYFDGQIDKTWIDHLNCLSTAGNKVHSWANGDTTLLNDYKLFFETPNLNYATPSLITNNFIISFDNQSFSWEQLLYAYIDTTEKLKTNAELKNYVRGLFENYFPKLHDFITNNKLKCLNFSENYVMKNLISLFDSVFPMYDFEDKKVGKRNINSVPKIEVIKRSTLSIFIFSLAWVCSFMTNFIIKSKIDKLINDIFRADDLKGPIFEYYIDDNTNDFEQWSNLLAMNPDYHTPYPEKTSAFIYNKIFIPHVENIPYQWILEKYIKNDIPVFYTGKPGIGKSLLINSLLDNMEKKLTEIFPLRYNINYSTKSEQVESFILNLLSPIKRDQYGDKYDRRVIFFADDCNLQLPDEFNSQDSIEYMRSIINNNYIYDMTQNKVKNLSKFNIITCCNLVSYPNSDNIDRFAHSLSLISQVNSDESYVSIFKTSLELHLRQYIPNYSSIMATQYIQASLKVYDMLVKEIKPTPKKLQYRFTLRDVGNILQVIHNFSYKSSTFPYGEALKKLWIHETSRVYEDRMNKPKDTNIFRSIVVEAYNSIFKNDKVTTESLYGPTNTHLFSANLMENTNEYIYCKDREDINAIVATKLEEFYKKTNIKNRNIILNDLNMLYIIKLLRLFQFNNSHSIVIGQHYSGKTSITQFVAFLSNREFREFEDNLLQKSYDYIMINFIYKILFECSYKNKSIILLVNNKMLENEITLEILNNLLNTKLIVKGYDFSEMGEKESEKLDEDEIIRRIEKNLTVIIGVVPNSKSYKKLFYNYPYIVKNCNVINRKKWKDDVYLDICTEQLKNIELSNLDSLKLANCILDIHQFVKLLAEEYSPKIMCNITIPSKYLIDTVEFYSKNLSVYRDILINQQKKYNNALDVVPRCEEIIRKINEEISSLEPGKSSNDKQIDEKKREISQRTIEKANLVTKKQDEEKIYQSLESQKEDTILKLVNILGPFNENVSKFSNPLNRLDKECVEIKNTWDNLPFGKYVLAQIYTMLGESNTEWEHIKKTLDGKMFRSLIAIDYKDAPSHLVKIVEEIINHSEFGTSENFQKPYKVCGLICDWIKSLQDYFIEYRNQREIMDEIDRLSIRIAEQKKIVDSYLDNLKEVENNLRGIEKSLALCERNKQTFLSQIDKKEILKKTCEEFINVTREKLEIWETRNNQVLSILNNVEFYTLFIAVYLHYASPFNKSYRQKLINFIFKFAEDFNLDSLVHVSFSDLMMEFLDTRGKDREFYMSLGGYDEYSKENFMIMYLNNKKIPYVIDPNRISKWSLTNYLQWKDMKSIISTKHLENMPDLYEKIDSALKNGSILFIEQCDERIYYLMKNVIKENYYIGDKGKKFVDIENVPKEINDRFKVYFIKDKIDTKIDQKIWSECLVINFSPAKLQTQSALLKVVALNEDPITWNSFSKSQIEIMKDKNRLMEIEEKLLLTFNQYDFTGNVEKNSNNEALLIKLRGDTDSHSLTMKSIEGHKERLMKYQSDLAKFNTLSGDSARLYKWITRFIYLDNIYNFSFIIFCKYIKDFYRERFTLSSSDSDEYTKNNLNDLIMYVYNKIALIFSYDQRKLLLMISVLFYLSERRIIPKNFKHTLVNVKDIYFDKNLSSDSYNENSPVKSISDFEWNCLKEINDKSGQLFDYLIEHIETHVEEWNKFLSEAVPDDDSSHFTNNFKFFDEEIEKNVNMFAKYLFFLIVKSHRFQQLSILMYESVLAKEFTVPKLNFTSAIKNIINRRPLLIVDSQDLSEKEIRDYYSKFILNENGSAFRTIILKGEFSSLDLETIRTSMKQGGLVLVKNVHLAKESLIKLFEELNDPKTYVNDTLKIIFICHSNLILSSSLYENCVLLNRNVYVESHIKDYIVELVEHIKFPEFDFFVNRKVNTLFSRKILFHLVIVHSVLRQYHFYDNGTYYIPFEFTIKDFMNCLNFIYEYLRNLPETVEIANNSPTSDSNNNYINLISLAFETFYCNRLIYKEEFLRVLKILMRYFEDERFANESYYFIFKNTAAPICNFEIPVDNIDDAMTADDFIKIINIIPLEKFYQLIFNIPETVINEHLTDIGRHHFNNLSILISGSKQEEKKHKAFDIDMASVIVQTLQRKLPDLIKLSDAGISTFKIGKNNEYINPLDESLKLEIGLYNKYLTTIMSDLSTISSILKGEMNINDEYHMIINDLLNETVPRRWMTSRFTRRKETSKQGLSEWRQVIEQTVEILKEWLMCSTLQVFYAPLFLNLKLFFFCVVNYFARKTNESPENIKLRLFLTKFSNKENLTEDAISEIVEQNEKECLFIQGFLIENSLYDNDKMMLVNTSQAVAKNGTRIREACPILGITYEITSAINKEEDESENPSPPNEEKNTILIPIYDREGPDNFEITEPISYVEFNYDTSYKEDYWHSRAINLVLDF